MPLHGAISTYADDTLNAGDAPFLSTVNAILKRYFTHRPGHGTIQFSGIFALTDADGIHCGAGPYASTITLLSLSPTLSSPFAEPKSLHSLAAKLLWVGRVARPDGLTNATQLANLPGPTGADARHANNTLRSGPRTVVKSTSVVACFEPLGGRCFCLKKQNSCAKNRSTPLDRLSEAISCEVVAYLYLREQKSFLTPHLAPASIAIDASPFLSLSGRVKCKRLMLCLSLYEWRCIYPGEQMILAPFLEKTSLDRAPGRFAENSFVPKHAKADVLFTTVLGPLRWPCSPAGPLPSTTPSWT